MTPIEYEIKGTSTIKTFIKLCYGEYVSEDEKVKTIKDCIELLTEVAKHNPQIQGLVNCIKEYLKKEGFVF